MSEHRRASPRPSHPHPLSAHVTSRPARASSHPAPLDRLRATLSTAAAPLRVNSARGWPGGRWLAALLAPYLRWLLLAAFLGHLVYGITLAQGALMPIRVGSLEGKAVFAHASLLLVVLALADPRWITFRPPLPAQWVGGVSLVSSLGLSLWVWQQHAPYLLEEEVFVHLLYAGVAWWWLAWAWRWARYTDQPTVPPWVPILVIVGSLGAVGYPLQPWPKPAALEVTVVPSPPD